MERPRIVTDEMLEYLDRLRESGKTNMMAAGRYLMEEFDLNKERSREVLSYWMKTFGDDER